MGSAMADMPGMTAGGAMASMAASGAPYGLLAAMWAVMMVGMMLPSAMPMILLYSAVERKRASGPLLRTSVFVFGYLVVWTGFALLAAGLQKLLADVALITPAMALASRTIAGGVMIFAGVYELTPLKQACLRLCRGPVAFVTAHWRAGLSGALQMGVRHGLYCTGCCWALMLLLFVGGVMNFAWILGLAALILAQKLAPGGRRSALVMSWVIAAVAIGAGLFAITRA